MLLRAALIAAVIATVPIGWAATSSAQAPVAATTTAPTSPVISADDQCGDGSEWSKTVGRCIPVPTAAPRHRRGRPFCVPMGTTPSARPPTVRAPDTAVLGPWSVSRRQ
jgi:hypothetical protein